MCLKCESGSSRFLPGEGPSRGLLRDCTTSPINRSNYYIYSCLYPHLARVLVGEAGWPDVAGVGDPPGQLHYRDVIVQRVGVPARVLDRPADSG